ncbi:MAG: MFS transporter [Dehalococcoidia bacterium]
MRPEAEPPNAVDAIPWTRPIAKARSRSQKVFYGWWIIAAGAALQALLSALMGQAYGAYVVKLREDFGWSKTQLSIAASLREAESGILSPIQGAVLDRLGARRVLMAGIVILGAGMMVFSQVQNLWQFYAAFLLMAVGASLAGYTSVTYAAVQWFERRRSTAISLTSAGFAVGGICVPLVAVSMDHFGWRATAFVSGILIIAFGLPLAAKFRSRPEDYGLLSDGETVEERQTRRAILASSPRAGVSTTDFTLGEAMRTPQFWFISGGHASSLFIVSALNVHLIPYLKESQGWSLGQASLVVQLLTLVQLLGTLTGGPLGDRLSKRWIVVACMAMHVSGLLLLAHAQNLGMILAFASLHGLAWGWRGPMMASMRADYFGRSSFGKILGVSNGLIIAGTITGPLLAGYMYDQTGNYRAGFDTLAVMAGLGSIFFVLSTRPKPPLRAAPLETP